MLLFGNYVTKKCLLYKFGKLWYDIVKELNITKFSLSKKYKFKFVVAGSPRSQDILHWHGDPSPTKFMEYP